MAGTQVTKSKLAEQVKEALAFPKQDHTHLLPSEIDQFELLVRQVDHGLYLDVVHRQAGELYELSWNTEVNLMAASGPMTAHRTTRRPLHA